MYRGCPFSYHLSLSVKSSSKFKKMLFKNVSVLNPLVLCTPLILHNGQWCWVCEQHTLEPVQGKLLVCVVMWLQAHYVVHLVATKQQCIITTGWLKSFSSQKPLWFGRWATLLPDDTENHNIPHILSTQTHTHTNTRSHIRSVFLPGSVFSLPVWCLPFHWLCLMQECVFLCLTLARGNNTSHWMVVCSGAFSDIQSLLF